MNFVHRRKAQLALSASFFVLAATSARAAGALPTGGNFVAGSGSIAQSSNALTVNQATQRGIINWGSFSIGQGNSVAIKNGAGATLNRVTGNSLSTISGSLTSTGSTYLINQNGVIVTPTGSVVTGGSFVASTRDTDNTAFLNGQALQFTGNSAGTVSNQGTVKSANGDVVLIGKSAENSGSISAPTGTAGVVAGDSVLLQPSGSGLQIKVDVGSGDSTNSGTIAATQAVLNAAGGNVYALSGNNGGLLRATGTATVNGHVWLTAGGSVNVSGAVAAQNADGSGGTITVHGANTNVSGALDASATAASGNGGLVSVVAEGTTNVSGTLTARAGASGGNGGSIETSGGSLDVTGATVDASAPKGSAGNWLLDPYDLTENDSAAVSINTSLGSGTNVTLQTTTTGTSGPGTPNASGNGDIFINSALSWSTTATLNISAYRNIDINANVTVSGGGTLSLTTGTGTTGDYIIAAGSSISFTGGPGSRASLTINSTPYTLLYSMSDVQNINNVLGGKYALATSLDASSVSSWIPLGTDGAGNVLSNYGFNGVITGLGNTISNLTIDMPSINFVAMVGYSTGSTIRNIGLVSGLVSGNYYVGELVGFNYSGTITNSSATGAVSGNYYVGGLVGYNYSGTITNSYASGAVTGINNPGDVGGLVGISSGTISHSYATGPVNGGNTGSEIGGLVGQTSGGSIVQSYAIGAVTGSYGIGGLAGISTSEIAQSYATGSVNGAYYVGGLVGDNEASIAQSYATGSIDLGVGVGNPHAVGGLVGVNTSSITQSYATGSVVAVVGSSQVGGLAGWNLYGTITQSYATGAVTGGSLVGGLVGYNQTVDPQHLASINQSYATGTVSGSFGIGGLVGYNDSASSVTESYAASAVSGNSAVGGLIGSNAGIVSSSYWDTTTSGQSTSAGGIGLTTAQFFTASNFAGFTFGTTPGGAGWVIVDSNGTFNNAGGAAGNTRPILLSEYSTGIVNAHQLQLMALNLSTNYTLSANMDASATDGGNHPSDLWTSAGFVPIGNSTARFAGLFDGQGHTISGLTINRPVADLVGLFGYVGSTGVLRNIGLLGGSVIGLSEVGELAGANDGSITGAYATGAVIGVSSSRNVGGLVGDSYLGTIFQSYATGPVSAGDGSVAVGGLVGSSYAAITQSYATGPVTVGANSVYVGGLAGFADGGITQSYASGAVSASSGSVSVGGLTGGNGYTITQSYATGAVSAGDNSQQVGGLVGFGDGYSIVGSYATGAVSVGQGVYSVGGLVGYNRYAIIQSYATGVVTAGINSAQIGGLAGNNSNAASIAQSYATGAVSAGDNSQQVGGLVGANWGSINQSYATGVVAAGSSSQFIGGLVGQNADVIGNGSIAQSFATGAVSGSSSVGGLVGYNNGGTVTSSYWDTTTSGQVASAGGLGLTTAQLSAALPTGFDSTVWDNVNNQTTPYLLFHPGTAYIRSDSTHLFNLITNTRDLQGINVSGTTLQQNYALANSVDASAVSNWVPIGTDGAGTILNGGNGFAGIFDGLGNTVSNLTINLPSVNYVGLFGWSSGTLRNVGVVGGNITGGNYVGGLVGSSGHVFGTIINSYATGTVSGIEYIGGLAGRSYGVISQSYATGAVSGADGAGGLVGYNAGTISNAFATGTVTYINAGGLVGDTAIGGLTAYNGGTIANSYSTGAVTGATYAGGLTGWNNGGAIANSYSTGAVTGATYAGGLTGYNSGAITNSYSTGAISGASSAGGLVGSNNGTITSGYWDTETSGQTTSAGGIGLTSAQLESALPAGFSSTVWGNGNNRTTPYLLSNPGPVYIAGDNTNLYTAIINIAQLQAINANLGGNYALVASLDATGVSNWVPLGTDGAGNVSNSSNGYSGIFDGLGNTISNLNINLPSVNFVALFGYSSGTIRNIGVIGGALNGNWYVGGLVGANLGAVNNAYATAAVTAGNGSNYVGGLVGDSSGTITQSYATGAVAAGSGSTAVGGLVGYQSQGTITQSYATGTVTAGDNSTDVGGLVGIAATITQSYEIGNVAAGNNSNQVGGLVGNNEGSISQSYATGAVMSNSSIFVGGLAGINGGSITQSYSTGTVIAGGSSTAVGGLVGYNGGAITESYATGAVSTGDNSLSVGGLAGNNDGSISQSYATGGVSAGASSNYVAGLAGINGGTITQSYATGAAAVGSGSTNYGGLVGYNSGGAVTFSYWDTTTTGQTTSDGGTGLTTAQFLHASNLVGFTFGTTPGAAGWVIVDADGTFNNAGGAAGNTRPVLLSEYSTNIVNAHQLQLMALNLSANYTLGADIDASGTNAASHPSDLWTGAGFVPIGNNTTNFTGTFDGQSHTISGLTVNRPSTSYVGLFGYSTGTLENVGLLGGVVSGLDYAGGLVGYNSHGIVGASYATGAVRGRYDAGGLVGRNDSGIISSSSATGAVTGSDFAGGLVGESDFGTIGTSFATGAVSGLDDVGGLVGLNFGTTGTSFATGAVSGRSNVGGLVGQNFAEIGTSYATGAVSGTQDVGGLVGNNHGDISNASATGVVSGSSEVGGLAGYNYGSISSAYATGVVSGTNYIGGLVGYNDNGATVGTSYATGAVSGNDSVGGLVGYNYAGAVTRSYATGAVNAGGTVGGLVGYNSGSVTQSYSKGVVSGQGTSNDVGGLVGENVNSGSIDSDFATGAVSGTGYVGGLVGYNFNSGTVTRSYATGTVTGINYVGGLLGYNNAAGVISSDYATGAVSGSDFVGGLVGINDANISGSFATGMVRGGVNTGGLVGTNDVTVTSSYWDIGTSGQRTSAGGTGMTTAQLQSSSLPAGFDPSIWATLGGESYPYLKWQFPTGTPQVVSGFVHDTNGSTPLSGATVATYFGGAPLQSVLTGGATTTGANGYYYYLLVPGTLPASPASAVGATATPAGSANVTGLSFSTSNGAWFIGRNPDGSATGIDITSGLIFARTSEPAYGALGSDLNTTFGASNYAALSTTLSGANLAVQATGAFSVDQAISRSGAIKVETGGDLMITPSGSLASSAAGDAIVLAANGSVINNAGAGALNTSNAAGRWLIYSQTAGSAGAAPPSDNFGGLSAKNYYGDLFSFGAGDPGNFASEPGGGNRFVYGYQPVVTVTPDTKTLTYNGVSQADSYSISGLINGDAASDGYTGAPALSPAPRNAGRYNVTAALGSLSSPDNYAFSLGSGTLTINPAALTIAAVSDSKVYNGTTDSSGIPTTTGTLYDTDSVSGMSQTFASKDVKGPNGSTLSVASYTVNDGNSGANYIVTTPTASGTITPAPLSISAVSDSKVYNGTAASSASPAVGTLYSTDSVTGLTQAFASRHVRGLNGSTLLITGYKVNDGNNGDDYTVTTTTAIGTITAASLDITAVTDSRQYDGTTNSSGTPMLGTLYSTDTVMGLSQAFTSKDVLGLNGSTLRVTGYSVNDGNSGHDYTVTTHTAMGTISAAPLDISAIGDAKQYDGTTNSSGTPVAGTLYGDTVTGLSQDFTSKDVLGLNGSTLSVTGYTVNDGNGGKDYAVTTHTAMGTITPAPLDISAVTDSRQYDGTTNSTGAPAFGTLYSTDTVLGLSQAFTSKDVLGLNGSTLSVTGYTVNDGNGGKDYAVTTHTAMGTITAASLDITAVTDSRQYDGTTNSSGTPMFGTLYSTDTVMGLSQAFTSKDVLGLNDSTLSVTGYTVNDGNSGKDYTVTTYSAMGTITPAPLDITAATDSRQYNGTTNSSRTPVVGTLYGDTVTGLSQAFMSKDVLGLNGSTLNVAGYTVNDGNGGKDYAVTTHTTSGTITPAPLDITAATDSRQYNGTTASSDTPTVAGTRYGTDSVTGLMQAFASKDVKGAGLSTLEVTGYTVNDGNGGANYTVATHTVSGTISPAALDISAVTGNRVYNGTTSSIGTPTVGTLYNTDKVTGLTQAFTSKDVKGAGLSTLAVTGYTVNDGNNGADYTITTHAASGTISPAPLNISAVTDSRTYNGTTSSTGTPTVATLYGTDTVTGRTQAFVSRNVLGVNGSTLSVTGYTVNDGNGGADYMVTTHTASGTITPAPLTIAAAENTKIADGTVNSAVTPTVAGLLDSDTVTGQSQVFDSASAGITTKTLSVNAYTVNDGNGGKNYSVTTLTHWGSIIVKGANLSGFDFTNQNLLGDNLKAYNLSGANATGAIFQNVNLQAANLKNVNFTNANLQGANLKGANVTGAIFTGADLTGATWTNGQVCQTGSIGTCK